MCLISLKHTFSYSQGENKLLTILDSNSNLYFFQLKARNTKLIPVLKIEPVDIITSPEYFINHIRIQTLGSKFYFNKTVDNPLKFLNPNKEDDDSLGSRAILKSSLGLIILRAVQMVMEQEFRKQNNLQNYMIVCESSG